MSDPSGAGEPITPGVTARGRAGKARVGATERARRYARRQKVLALRFAGVPVHLIAQNTGYAVSSVESIIRLHFKTKRQWSRMGTLLRKWEKEQQLESNDAQLMRVVSLDVLNPQELQKHGLTAREWLEASRLSLAHKDRLIRLHGLDGTTAAGEAGPGASGPVPEPVERARVIRGFVEGIEDADVRDKLIGYLIGQGRGDLEGGGGGEVRPEPGGPQQLAGRGNPGGERPGGDGPGGPVPPS